MNLLTYEFVLALRRLWRRKTQSGLMLVTFTISIALSLLSWSIFHTMFVRQPEFDPAGNLAIVNLIANTPGAKPVMLTHEDLRIWRESQTVFSDMAPISIYRSVFIATKDSARRYLGALLSSDAMRMLGAQPLLGRMFTAEEDKFRCPPVIILSQQVWERNFAGDPGIIGRTLRVDGYGATVVGVMPASFRFPNSQDVWLPLGFDVWNSGQPDDNTLDGLVRLKPGTSIARATEDLRLIMAHRGPATNAAKYNLRPVIIPAREYYLNSDMRASALVLMALSLVFVLVSCANAANLVMIDFFGRTAELAASLALGLPRSAAIRGLCFQVLILAAFAAVIGLAVLVVAAPFVHQSFVLMLAPYWLHFDFGWHHVAMAAGLAVLSAGVAILVPASYLFMANPEKVIRDGAGTSRGTGRGLWRRSLLIGQLALLTILGIAAGLLMQSNRQLGEERWGYDASKVFLGKLNMPKTDFPTQPERLVVFRKVVAAVSRLSGMRGVAIIDSPPGYPVPARTRYAIDPATLLAGREDGLAVTSEASEGVFDALGVPFVAGSTFPAEIKQNDPAWIVVNASLAARLWPGRDAIGQALYTRWPWMEPKEPAIRAVVRGVVRDFQAANPQMANNDLIMLPFRGWTPATLFLMAGGQAALPSTKEITDAVWSVDPRVVPYFPDSIKHQIDMQLGFVRLTTNLTAIYALAAVLLCGVGVYSITVAQILQRNREFGIRLALGIEPFRLWVRFARGHLLTAAVGVGVGAVAATGAMRALQSMLYGVQPRDPITFGCVAAGILVVSFLACVPSLFRLQRIKPADCLRSL
ncbi:MAG: macB 21 [Verrucomicrobia bacterium]|nr:macB 21 [Verrucomicrobiota bacterium]